MAWLGLGLGWAGLDSGWFGLGWAGLGCEGDMIRVADAQEVSHECKGVHFEESGVRSTGVGNRIRGLTPLWFWA